ncbi:MAG: aspartate aminotransferase family protein [Gammaproteobacteria bacterium]|jgi:4-aminobutyrate aminotransferase-like enzyme|nr:MAG: aspartate aminotransferase family protein [Gammaproteobacteria bacterium]
MSDVKDRRDAVFGAGSTLFYEEPVHIVRGDGVHLHAADGTRYIDMYNNVPSVGHCHPHVVEAVSRQLGTLNVHNRYLHEAILEYGERLVATHHDGIENVVFSCTGTEANEVALMMARAATGGQGIICTDAAYHGNTTEVRKLNHCSSQTGDIRSVPFPDLFRFESQDLGDDALTYYLGTVEETIAGFQKDGIPFAGLLFCPIFANEGLPTIPDGYLPEVARLVHEAGGVFICDEVQAGLCRTGNWWGYEIQGVEPDIVSMGKPLGAGMPLAATAGRRDLVENFRRKTRYFNTFASSPAQAAAGNAVLDVIESELLLASVNRVGDWLRAELAPFMDRCDSMADVRGAGLFVSLEWVKDRQSREPDAKGAVRVVDMLKARGFLTSNAGAYRNVVKLRPPLVFAQEHAEAFIDAFRDVIDHLHH